jgi:hypothetical protein
MGQIVITSEKYDAMDTFDQQQCANLILSLLVNGQCSIDYQGNEVIVNTKEHKCGASVVAKG